MLSLKKQLNHDELWQELKQYVWEIKNEKEAEIRKYHHSGTEPFDVGMEIGSSMAFYEIFEKMNQLESL